MNLITCSCIYFLIIPQSFTNLILNKWINNISNEHKLIINELLNKDITFSKFYIYTSAKKYNWCGANIVNFIENDYDKQKLLIHFSKEIKELVQLSNYLSQLHTSLPISTSTKIDEDYYIILLRELLKSNSNLSCSTIALDPSNYYEAINFTLRNPISPHICKYSKSSMLFHYSSIATDSKLKYAINGSIGYEWYWHLRKDYSYMLWKHRSICQSNSSISNWITLDDILINWAHFDCSSFEEPNWILPISLPFFGCNLQQQLLFQGVVKIDINLDSLIHDHCSSKDNLFSLKHKCFASSSCKTTDDLIGDYVCQCNEGYYLYSNKNFSKNIPGSKLEEAYIDKLLNQSSDWQVECLPCKSGCSVCDENGECLFEFDFLTRGIPFAIECATIFSGIVLIVIIGRMRNNRVIKTSFWFFLEVIIIGAIVLHITVLMQYFGASPFTCLLLTWLKELGGTALYCSLTLKLLHYLSEFQSRKAHRVQVKDTDLLKQLCIAIFVVIGYLVTWTAAILDEKASITSLVQQNEYVTVCAHHWRDFAIDSAELSFLLFSLYICYRARAAPSPYFEVRYIFISMHLETSISLTYYIFRTFLHDWFHPDYSFLLLFLRHQLSTTATISLIIGSKFWYLRYPPREKQMSSRMCAEDFQLGQCPPSPSPHKSLEPKMSEGSKDLSSINLPGVTLDDISDELKRLHTQLKAYKSRLMLQDAHNLKSKAGGQGRKGGHGRRFSIQAFYSQHQGSFRSKGRSYQAQQSTGSSVGPELSPPYNL